MITKIKQRIIRMLAQGQPSGLFSLRYFLPFQDKLTSKHRQMWWASKHPRLPRIIWAMFELYYWMRWNLFGAWRASFLTQKSHGANVDMAPNQQILRLLRYAYGWSVHPISFYQSGAFLRKGDELNTVFPSETKGFHALLNRAHSNSSHSVKLLADKQKTAKHLAGVLPVVAELDVPTGASCHDLCSIKNSLFFKLRGGNAGLGAFEASIGPDGLQGRRFSGEKLADADAVEQAFSALKGRGPILVQPRLGNHPELAPLTDTNAAITIRIITLASSQILAAFLEVPFWRAGTKDQIGYYILPIDPKSGAAHAPKNLGRLPQAIRQNISDLIAKLDFPMPHWAEICDHSIAAHTRHFDLWGIAWDWVITSSGPQMLEGNSAWGLTDVQNNDIHLLDRLD